MSEQEEVVKQIIDDIEARLIDDPLEDYRYLKAEVEKYTNHEQADAIFKELGRMMYVDIPSAARKGLKNDLSGDCEAYNTLIDEANNLMLHGQWGAAAAMIQNLMGDGIGVDDRDDVEFRTLQDDIQEILYSHFFKSENKEVVKLPINLGKLYGLFGCLLVEYKQFDSAEQILENSLHYNPLELRFFFEYAESLKAQGKFEQYEKLSRQYLEYAYKAVDIGHLYRNLGYIYIEKKDYETAVMLYNYSQAYDPENKMAEQELKYIEMQTGRLVKYPTQEEADAVLNREGIQIGVSDKVFEILYRNAYAESHVSHDVEKTEYFCKMLLDVSRDEDLVNELLDVAKDKSKGIIIFGGMGLEETDQPEYQSPYDKMQADSLKEIFPNFPDMDDCKLRITFTINSAKYEETIYQILTHIDEMSKLVENKDVTVYFADLQSVEDNIKYINDLIAVAGGWKSFKLSLNDNDRDKYQFRYFTDYLKEKLGVAVPWGGSAEDIQKAYRKEAAPKKAKKQRLEDGFKVNLEGCTPQEIITGVANTYANVYLSDFDVKAYRISDDEIVLTANDDFVVDIWVSPYGYGRTMFGDPDDSKPYEYCTYVLQELSKNNLFKYNASAFERIFYGAAFGLESLRFNGPDYYSPEVNHFYKIDAALPELQLKAKYEEFQGDPYNFIVFEMENADGSIGSAIGYTDKKPRTLLVKICKELETRTPFYLEGNCAPGLVASESDSFIKAFLSWKSEKKTKRLEAHLKYFCLERVIKEKDDGYDVSKEIMSDYRAGKYAGTERKTYSDIGRR